MKNIIVTGGMGYIGGRLIKKFSDSYNVIVSSRNEIKQEILELHGATSCIKHKDLLSKEKFPTNIYCVIHLASLNEWDCINKPSEAIRVNIDDTRAILENSILNGVSQFIYFSTAHIYGSPLIGDITEESLPLPIHPYAITHKAAEDYVVAATLQNKIKGVVIRLSNSFGAPIIPSVNRWTLLANDLCKQAIEQGKLKLLSNGCQYRDFICLTDVVNAVEKILHSNENQFEKKVYNLGSGLGFKVIDLANMIIDSYLQIFNKNILLELPLNSVETKEPYLNYSINKILNEGIVINNDFNTELKNLLNFCALNFKKID